MKTGVIVYLVGAKSVDKNFDATEAFKHLDINADRVEVVMPGFAQFDVMDAWWLLTVKGMQRIVCKLAEIVDNSRIRFVGRELVLCG